MSAKVDWVYACCPSVDRVYQVDESLFDKFRDGGWYGPFWLQAERGLGVLSISPDGPPNDPPPQPKKGTSK